MSSYKISIKLRVKPASEMKRVAILGAGPAGIVSAKYAVENGFLPVVFDKKATAGGLWAAGTAIWDDMHSNSSRYSVMFSDFGWPDKTSIIPSAKDVYNYLLSYIDHFKIASYFQFNTIVQLVKQLPNKKWQIIWTNYLTGDRTTEVYDYLICSSGLHCMSSMPSIKNSENFKGEILHSNNYKSKDPLLKNKRVVVVGNSYSGAEISSHLVGYAKSITNVFSRPYLVFPRLLKIETEEKNVYNIYPNDLFYSRELAFKARTREEERKLKIDIFSKLCPIQTNKKKSHPDMYYELNDDEPIREAVTDNYYSYVTQGKIRPKRAKITQFETNGIRLSDGSFEKADAVLFCTGYKLCLDFFDDTVLKTLKFNNKYDKFPILLYKFTFHPDLENLAMIGVTSGLFFAGFELQAKWAFKVFKGEKKLPPRSMIDSEIAKDESARESLLRNQYPHGYYNEIIDKLAQEVDDLPNFKRIAKTDPKLFDMLWKNGTIPAHFSLKINREFSQRMMREVDEMMNKRYYLTKDEIESPSSYLLAKKFGKNYRVPLHLFNDKTEFDLSQLISHRDYSNN